ncbi:MAG: hypothetical protein V3R81_15160 [Gammaproteobacteria bacterium]
MQTYNKVEQLATLNTFIAALFGDVTPWVGSYYQKTASVVGKLARSKPRQGVYFNCASFNLDESGAMLRRKTNFRAFHVLVLDDIGTKVPANDLLPTYRLTSSQGNEQWGYVLDVPLEQSAAESLLERVKQKGGLGDAGALKVSQLLRLPMGVNAKVDEHTGEINQFPVHLVSWNPERVFTVTELVDAWGLDDVDVMRVDVSLVVDNDVAPMALADMGAFIEGLADIAQHVRDVEVGKVHLECPNAGAHSRDTGAKQTSLLVAEDGRYTFKCLHGSCVDFDFDMWRAARAKLPTAHDEASVAMADVTGEAAVASGRNVTQGFVERLVVLLSGGYYDLAAQRFLRNRHTLDTVYGGLGFVDCNDKEVMPGTILQRAPQVQLAEGMGWQAGGGAFIIAGEQRYVNTYQREVVAQVNRPDIIAAWLNIGEHICAEHHSLVLDHMAFTVQFPQTKIHWQILVHGKPRTGKTMTFAPLVMAMGTNAGTVAPATMEAGWGNMYYKKRALLFEEIYQYDRRMFNSLKGKLANNDFESLNIKGGSPILQQNLYSMYMLTNHDDAIDMAEDEDKLLIIHAPAKRLDAAIYSLMKQDEAATAAAVYGYLLGRDVSGFSHGMLPVRTKAMCEMIAKARPGYVQAIEEMVNDQSGPFLRRGVKIKDILETLRNDGYGNNRKGVVRAMRSLGWSDVLGQKKVNSKNEGERFWGRSADVDHLTSAEKYEYYLGVNSK